MRPDKCDACRAPATNWGVRGVALYYCRGCRRYLCTSHLASRDPARCYSCANKRRQKEKALMGMKPRKPALKLEPGRARTVAPDRPDGHGQHVAATHAPHRTVCGIAIASTTASIVKPIDGEITPSRIGCGTCRKYVERNADEFKRPVHYYPGEPATQAECGEDLQFAKADDFTDEFGKVRCEDCVKSFHARAPSPIVHDMARILITNALGHAEQSGKRLTRESCMSCGATYEKTACVSCAVLEYRGIVPDKVDAEDEIARILAVPREWVLSLIGGWDGDRSQMNHPYSGAYFLGRKLWRKHAKQHA